VIKPVVAGLETDAEVAEEVRDLAGRPADDEATADKHRRNYGVAPSFTGRGTSLRQYLDRTKSGSMILSGSQSTMLRPCTMVFGSCTMVVVLQASSFQHKAGQNQIAVKRSDGKHLNFLTIL